MERHVRIYIFFASFPNPTPVWFIQIFSGCGWMDLRSHLCLSDFIIGSGFFSCAHVHVVLFQFPCFLIFFFFFSLGNCTSWFPFVVQGTNLNYAFLCTNWPTLKNLGLKGNPLIVALNWGYQFLVTTQVTVLAYFSRNCAFGFSKLKKLRIDVS